MAIARLLRDNLALSIGLALPVVVVLLFLIASRAPGLLAAPPAHDLLLRAEGTPRPELSYRVTIDVVGSRLRARLFRFEPAEAGRPFTVPLPTPRLYLWAHEEQALREIEIELPDNVDSLPNGAEISLGELEGRRLATALRAPDGYEYLGAASGRASGLFGLLFDGGERRIAIANGGNRVAISLPSGLPYWTVEFVGWVVD